MTPGVDFDHLLRSWLDDETTTVPDDSLDRAMSRIGRTRQRPTWLVADGLTLPTARAPLGVPAWVLLVSALLMAVAVAVVGARLLETDVTPIVRPSPRAIGPVPSQAAVAATVQPTPTPSSPPGPTGGRLILAYTNERGVIGPEQVLLIDAGTGERTVLGTLPGMREPGTHAPRYRFVRVGANLVVIDGEVDRSTTVGDLTDAGRAFEFRSSAELLATCCSSDLLEFWAMSPDGQRIAGVRTDDKTDTPLDILFADLGGVHRDRSAAPSRTGLSGLAPSPWAPDGTAVLAVGCQPCNKAASPVGKQTPEHRHLYIVRVDGSPWRGLLDIDNGAPEGWYSPDGSTILAGIWICAPGSFMPRCDPMEAAGSIVTIDVVTGRATRLRDETRLRGLSWSPDGTRILYGSKRGWFVMGLDGSDEVSLDVPADAEAQWSPDGRWILVEDFDGGDRSISLRVVPADGSAPARQIATNVNGATW